MKKKNEEDRHVSFDVEAVERSENDARFAAADRNRTSSWLSELFAMEDRACAR